MRGTGGRGGTLPTQQERLPAWHGLRRGPTSLAAFCAHAGHADATARATTCQIGSNQSRNGAFSRHISSSPASTAQPRSPGASVTPEGSQNHPPSTQSPSSVFSGVLEEGAFKSREERCMSKPPQHKTPGNGKGAAKVLPSCTRTPLLTAGGSCRHLRILNRFSYYSD